MTWFPSPKGRGVRGEVLPRLARAELLLAAGAERIAVELDLHASPAAIIQIEQQVAHRAALELADQRCDRGAIVGLDRSEVGYFELADAAEVARQRLSGEGQRAGPTGVFFLVDDQRAAAIEQEMKFCAVGALKPSRP